MRYAELHAKTNFSFLEGASHPDELVRHAAELGYAALAITDRSSLAGVVRAHVAAQAAGIKLLIGAEIAPEDAPAVVLWATDRAGYGRLARLITRGRRRAEKGQCHLRFADVAEASEGLLAGVIPTAVPSASSPASFASCPGSLEAALHDYRDVFGDRCYVLAELHRGPDDQGWLDYLAALGRRTRLPLVAAGDVHYHLPERKPLCDLLAAIRRGTTLAEAAGVLFPNAERFLRPVAEIAALFRRIPEAVARTAELADRCTFSLSELRYEYPEEVVPAGRRPISYLAELTWSGAQERYPRGVPDSVRRLLEHELRLIEELRYEAYFLTVWDLVRFARSRGILCQGRGSAANSAVCYCLGITAVDPQRIELLFERFVSRHRNEAPDIDVDFEHQRREEVLQYLYEKYGRERAGLCAEVITYRPRSAVRDVGKALGLSWDRVDKLAKNIEHFDEEPHLAPRCRECGIDPESPAGRQLIALVNQLVGFPRHLSQHVGGMVISKGPLCEIVPIENAAMPDRTVLQWNKDDLDALGILKIDCLGLGILSAIRRSLEWIHQHENRKLSLAEIPEGDQQVYAMIRRADTMGVFQIESRAQMSMLPRLQPRGFYDLVIEVAIVRPGPIQGNMVHPYLRRRTGQEPVVYPTPEVRQVLEKTLGVPLFQEQAMRLAIVAAGFTASEADLLRRAMGAWRRPGIFEQFRTRLIQGMLARGIPPRDAQTLFEQIQGFGQYGFPESHAASFALLVYVSAWLKCHYPAAYCAALLNSQPMGFYAPAQLVQDARKHGVEIRPVDINSSDWETTLEPAGFSGVGPRGGAGSVGGGAESSRVRWAVRLGLHQIRGLAEAHGRRLVAARSTRPFASLDDFARRTGLPRSVLVRLAQAGAFGSLGLDRRQALWHALGQQPESLPLFDRNPARLEPPEEPFDASMAIGPGCMRHSDGSRQSPGGPLPSGPPEEWPEPQLPPLSLADQVLADYQMVGLSLQGHPMQLLRKTLARLGVVRADQLADIPDRQPVRVAGLVLVRQRPSTAKGITFVTLEDETAQANLIIRPQVWQRYRRAALHSTILLASGRLQRERSVIHVLVESLHDLSAWLGSLAPQSRDFA